jgi:hypothetical protein
MGITVKALSAGYYGTRRRPGDIFDIESEQDRGKWMGEVGDATIPKEQRQPFTSVVKGTEAGGNVFASSGKKPAWEEPASEEYKGFDENREDPAKSPIKRKSRSKTKSKK